MTNLQTDYGNTEKVASDVQNITLMPFAHSSRLCGQIFTLTPVRETYSLPKISKSPHHSTATSHSPSYSSHYSILPSSVLTDKSLIVLVDTERHFNTF